MTETNRYPSYLECVARTLSATPEPLTLEALIAGVEQTRPMTKGGRSAIYRALDSLYQAVPVGATRIGWLARLLQGSTIRHSLESDELHRGFILLDELEHALFFPEFFQEQAHDAQRTLQIELFGGPVIRAEVAAERDIWALRLDDAFAIWLDEAGAMRDDDLIISVDDAVAGRYSVRLQPREIRDEAQIDRRNRLLARTAEEVAEEILHRRPRLYTWELVARLVGRGVFRDRVPPDDMHYVLDEYSRLHLLEGVGYELELREPSRHGAVGAQRTRGQALVQRTQAKSAPSAKPIKGSKPSPHGDSLESTNQQNANRRSQAQGGSMDDFGLGNAGGSDEETCDAYEEYLEAFETAARKGKPLSHDDYHLLEAELEMLVDLELEFGYLLAEQLARKQELADRLFIDPETLIDGPWEDGDDLDADSPALWN